MKGNYGIVSSPTIKRCSKERVPPSGAMSVMTDVFLQLKRQTGIPHLIFFIQRVFIKILLIPYLNVFKLRIGLGVSKAICV